MSFVIQSEEGLAIAEIVSSHQGRGPHTGICLSEGYMSAGGQPIPVRPVKAADYPVYNYHKVLACLRDKARGDRFVGDWLNGRNPDLILSDTPAGFEERVLGLVDGLIAQPGVRIVATHFELVKLVHGLYVEDSKLGEIGDQWLPTKSGGILLVPGLDGLVGYEYRPDLTIVE